MRPTLFLAPLALAASVVAAPSKAVEPVDKSQGTLVYYVPEEKRTLLAKVTVNKTDLERMAVDAARPFQETCFTKGGTPTVTVDDAEMRLFQFQVKCEMPSGDDIGLELALNIPGWSKVEPSHP